MSEPLDHILLPDTIASTETYTSVSSGGGGIDLPKRDRQSHAQYLASKFDAIWANVADEKDDRQAHALIVNSGTYLEFSGASNYDLISKSLEDIGQGVRLLNVRTVTSGDDIVNRALVYIPNGKERFFLNKIEKYANEDTKKGNPKNASLVNSIEDVQIALLESFWPPAEHSRIPKDHQCWCEVWLRIDSKDDFDEQITSFQNNLQQLDIPYKNSILSFPERAILLIKANRQGLIELIKASDQLAEYRIGQEAASFWLDESNIGQTEWAKDLLNRLEIEDSDVKICILDSGVNNGHMLLEPILSDEDSLTVENAWGTDDQTEIAPQGHGTLMAGLVGYGDLQTAFEATDSVLITHKLCSVKILPRRGQSPVEHWGAYTEEAIYRSEVINPEKILLYCMAVTSPSDVDRGKPSSWSGTIDQVSFGNGRNQRLFIVSGGNVVGDRNYWAVYPYPESSRMFSVQNPAQSWNALTVGAYTEKTQITDNRYDTFQRLAPPGGISPHSSTSLLWDKKWPIKPEILFEGGNKVRHPDGSLESHGDLGLLTTARDFNIRPFDSINATSAATAQASWLAAKIQHRYPLCWPETVRALIIHSASWTDQMKSQFRDMSERLRCCGYGVPDFNRSLNSFENGFTFISQQDIQPYKREKSDYKTNEMHFYNLPWPKDLLLSLGETPVKLRITLSYFIDPSPGEIGWKDKYRYQSFGLRFDLNRVDENKIDFKKRINKLAREEGEEIENTAVRQNWVIGSQKRNTGSVHSDIWEGTAADIADCNMLAVYPVIGWWRERHHLGRYNQRGRYALVVSLDTPAEEIPLYSTVQAMIQVPVEIPLPISNETIQSPLF